MYLVTKILLFLIMIIGFLLSKKLFTISKSAKFIAVYTLFISLIALNQILSYYNETINIFPIFNTLIGFMLAPLLFFHTISLFKVKNLKVLLYKHFTYSTPAICLITYWIFDDYRRKLLFLNDNSYITILITIQCLTYSIFLFNFINSKKLLIRNIKPTLQYSRIHLAIKLFVIHLFTAIIILFENFSTIKDISKYLVLLIFSLLMIQIIIILFKLKNNSLFFRDNDKLINFQKKTPHLIELVLDETDQRVLNELQKLMTEHKVFKDSKLNLNILADKLNVTGHNLSEILNNAYELSYKDYISFLRLEEAKKLLKKPAISNIRINEIMYEVGFNSKSAFNTWFKKNTGFTPTEYKKGSD